jgi:hypothetical protein
MASGRRVVCGKFWPTQILPHADNTGSLPRYFTTRMLEMSGVYATIWAKNNA